VVPAPQVNEETEVVAGGVAGTEGSQETDEIASTVTDPPNQTKQPHDLNAKMAEMRIKATTAERRAIEAETARKRDQEVARKYGKDYNVYSDADVEAQWGKSHGIKTVAEFEAALQKEAQDQVYKDKGIDPDAVKEIINSSPEMQALRAQQGKDALASEISELSAEYPELKVKTLEDMQNMAQRRCS